MKKLAILIAVPLTIAGVSVATAAAKTAHASASTTITTAHTKLGTILVGPNGHHSFTRCEPKKTKSVRTPSRPPVISDLWMRRASGTLARRSARQA